MWCGGGEDDEPNRSGSNLHDEFRAMTSMKILHGKLDGVCGIHVVPSAKSETQHTCWLVLKLIAGICGVCQAGWGPLPMPRFMLHVVGASSHLS